MSTKLHHKTLLCICLFGLLLLSSGCASSEKSATPAQKIAPHIPTLYLLSDQGDFDAYRADGTPLWHIAHQGDDLTELQSVGTHLLITSAGIAVATNTLALYTAAGHLIWSHTLSQQAETATFLNQTLYVIEQGGIITAWDLHGNLLWQQTSIFLLHTFVTATDGYLLFVGSASKVVALDQQTGQVKWAADIGIGAEQVEQLIVQNHFLVVQTGSSLSVLDTASGHTVWYQTFGVISLFVDASSATIDILSYGTAPSLTAPSLPEGLFALALPTGKIRWQRAFPLQLTSVGTVSAQGFLWASGTQITSWDLNGNQRWQLPYQGTPIVSVSSIDAQHSFLLIAHDGTIQNLDASSGHLRWHQMAAEGPSDAFPTLVHGNYIWIMGAIIEAIRPTDGSVQWQMTPTVPAAEMLVQ